MNLLTLPVVMQLKSRSSGRDPPTAMYGVVTPEEILVVDIDKKPEGRLKAPSDKDIAKARHPMKNPPKWK